MHSHRSLPPTCLCRFFANSESGNQNCTSTSEGEIAAQNSVDTFDNPDDFHLDLDATEDDFVPSGSGFEYGDAIINELMHDRFGASRTETLTKTAELLGTSTDVAGQRWTVRDDLPYDIVTHEDYLELGLRSNDTSIDSLPKRQRAAAEIRLGRPKKQVMEGRLLGQ